jgi:hypothetical protein
LVMHSDNHSQSSVELAISIVGAFLLLYAAFNLLIWLNNSLIRRNTEYEKTRSQATTSNTAVLVNEADYPKLHIMVEKD